MHLVQLESGTQFQMKVINLLGDATKLKIESNSVDLVITHPPYIGVDVERYGGDSSSQINFSQNEKNILKLFKKAFMEVDRVLRPGGNLILANNPKGGFDAKLMVQVMKTTSLQFSSYYAQHSDEPHKNITIWQHYVKGGQKGFSSFIGTKRYGSTKIECDINNEKDLVDIQLAKEGFHIFDAMHKDVPTKFINMFSEDDHVVLDPFGGSGIVAVTAAQMGRVGITNDISTKQFQAAQRRMELSL